MNKNTVITGIGIFAGFFLYEAVRLAIQNDKKNVITVLEEIRDRLPEPEVEKVD